MLLQEATKFLGQEGLAACPVENFRQELIGVVAEMGNALEQGCGFRKGKSL